MGRLSVCYCLALLTLSCPLGLSGFKATEVDHTFNETESNDVQMINEVSIDDRNESTSNPHSMADKPSKLDLDVSDMIYMDSKKIAEMETQVDSSVQRKSKCQNSISIDCLETKLSSFIDDMSSKSTVNITEAIQVVRTEATPAFGDDSLLSKVHRFAKSHVMRISLDKDLMPSAESRTFFGGK